MGVRTNEGMHTGNICVKSREYTCNWYEIGANFIQNFCAFRTNSREVTPLNRLQACRVLVPLVLGVVWAWWMLLGLDLHWMMRNEVDVRILPPQIPQKEPKIWRFPPENLEIWVDSPEYSRPIQMATYPPFTNGTGGYRAIT